MATEDYYKILGVSKTATDEDIKKAYRKLAQEHHPDRPTGNEKKFKEINEAYQVLSNKDKRAQYDRFGKTFSGNGGPGFSGFGNGAGFEGFDFNFGDMGDISDIFETFFTGMGGKRRKTYTRGSDLQFVADITLEEAYRGLTKDVQFKAFESCKECAGLGYFEKAGTTSCTTCDGRGEIKEVRNSFFGAFQQVRACGKCNATGQIPNKVCGSCKGSGRVMGTRSLKVEILPGIADGQLIKVPGVGEVGERGAPAGDLYVQVRVAPHKTFLRERDDLVTVKPLKVVDLLVDRSFEIVAIGGEKVSIEIPPGFDLRQRLKIAGKGMPHFGRSGRGDLYVAFEVRAPKKVSAKAKKIIEELSGEFE